MKLPRGFTSTGVRAGIKPSGKPDLALLVGDGPLSWAMVATRNRLTGACVSRNRRRHASGEPVRAIVMNAGNANCATGEQGMRDDEEMAVRTASVLGVAPGEVLTASTGVIGVRLPVDKVRSGLEDLEGALTDDSDGMAHAILTTDLRAKQVEVTLSGGARIVGVAKGSGMIHPDMATMLAFVATDARVSQPWLREVWPEMVGRTFNQVTVDGDTSPNDMALVLSSDRVDADPQEFAEALEAVATELSEKIAADGEGASTLVRVHVVGARNEAEARSAALQVAGSSLVKAAVHGRDPNWGRILSALGQSGAIGDPANVEISLQGTPVYRGAPLPFDEAEVSAALEADIVEIHADLGAGEARGRAWGCDLTSDYVRINADYTT